MTMGTLACITETWRIKQVYWCVRVRKRERERERERERISRKRKGEEARLNI